MKRLLMICLLAIVIVSGNVSCACAQSTNESPAVTAVGASQNIVNLCAGLDQVVEQLRKEPSKLPEIVNSIEKQTGELEPNQKLTAADKALLKKTMKNLMKVVVETQMEQNPVMAQMFGNMTDDQKKEAISMAMKTVEEQVDSKIDACETLGDFDSIQM